MNVDHPYAWILGTNSTSTSTSFYPSTQQLLQQQYFGPHQPGTWTAPLVQQATPAAKPANQEWLDKRIEEILVKL